MFPPSTMAGTHGPPQSLMMTDRDGTRGMQSSGPSEGSAAHWLMGVQARAAVRPGWQRRRAGALAALSLLIGAAACNGVLPTPSRDASQGQMMMDLTEALNQIRDQSAGLQEQLDSLREVVYHQDTIIRQLAQNAGITVPPPK